MARPSDKAEPTLKNKDKKRNKKHGEKKEGARGVVNNGSPERGNEEVCRIVEW